MTHKSLALFTAVLLVDVTFTAGRQARPVVINTWPFTEATTTAWEALEQGRPSLDAVQQGCQRCEQLQCDGTVGFGGSPDEDGQTTLDAMIMNGTSMEVGAVCDLQDIKEAVLTARLVMEHTQHSMLAGLSAANFAVQMGLAPANLTTEASSKQHADWQANKCQPNFWKDVDPNPRTTCGPYKPRTTHASDPGAQSASHQQGHHGDEVAAEVGGQQRLQTSRSSHDTISMVALDAQGNVAAASSSNGATHKVPGRVGDACVAGGGAYAETGVGGCGSTGDGDIHLRFLPCFQVVETLRQSSFLRAMHPQSACEQAIHRIVRVYPDYVGALVAVDRFGRHGAAAHGWNFSYSVRSSQMDEVEVIEVAPLEAHLSPIKSHSRELGVMFHDWWEWEGRYLGPCMRQALRSLWPWSDPHPHDQALHGKCP